MTITRKEHMDWAKERALSELDAPGQSASEAIASSFASLVSDLNKHAETMDHPGNMLGMQLVIGGHITTREQMRRHIEGYN